MKTEILNQSPAALFAFVQDRLLWISAITMTALTVAIVFLMTVKPGFIDSLVTFAIAIVLGYITSIVILKSVSTDN